MSDLVPPPPPHPADAEHSAAGERPADGVEGAGLGTTCLIGGCLDRRPSRRLADVTGGRVADAGARRGAAGTHAVRGQAGHRRTGPDDRADARRRPRPGALPARGRARASPRPWRWRRWRRSSAAASPASSSPPTWCRPTSSAPDLPRVEREVRRRAGPGLRELPARRRDQPGAGEGAVRPARGDGRAAGLASAARPTRSRARSWSWPRRTRSSRRASTRCPRRSATGSCSRSWSATPPMWRSARSSTGWASARRSRTGARPGRS